MSEIQYIQKTVAEKFSVDLQDILSKKSRGKEPVALARMSSMFLCCEHLNMDFDSVGLAHNRDRATVRYACKSVPSMLETQTWFRIRHTEAEKVVKAFMINHAHRTQDSKFWIANNRLVGQSGEVPADEPLFILRGRDVLSRDTIAAYLALCEKGGADRDHIAAVRERLRQFEEFKTKNPHRMKTPDTDPSMLHDRQVD